MLPSLPFFGSLWSFFTVGDNANHVCIVNFNYDYVLNFCTVLFILHINTFDAVIK